jgi:signal transduction histidine kinase/ligand-binding sensor domain-containing protein
MIAIAIPSGVEALDPSRPIAQLAMQNWKLSDGAPPDIFSIAQTPDGRLWLGTGAGLFSFDGFHFEHAKPAGDGFPSTNITRLAVAPSGDLWIGYQDGGVSLLRDGRLSNFQENFPSGPIIGIIIDKSGGVWASVLKNTSGGGLMHYDGRRWLRVMPPEWPSPNLSPAGVFTTSDGSIWVNTLDHGPLLVRKPGWNRFRPVPGSAPSLSPGLYTADRHDRIVQWNGLTKPIFLGPAIDSDGKDIRPPQVALASPSPSKPIIFDRDGAAWASGKFPGIGRYVATPQGGISTNAPQFLNAKSDLLSDLTGSPFEDREGNIWFGTNIGLVKISNSTLVGLRPYSSGYFASRMVTDGTGTIFVPSQDSLYVMDRQNPRLIEKNVRFTTAICGAKSGGVWIATERTFGHHDAHGRFSPISPPAGVRPGQLSICHEDNEGRLWVGAAGKGLAILDHGKWTSPRLPDSAIHESPAIVAADANGDVWLYYSNLGVFRVHHGDVRRFGVKDGLDIGSIGTIAPCAAGLFIGGDRGIAAFDGKRFTALTASRYEAFSRVTGIVQLGGTVWLNGFGGIVQIPVSELLAAFADPRKPLGYQILDPPRPLQGLALQAANVATALVDKDRMVWFALSEGLAWTDPLHRNINRLPPPTQVQALKVDDKPVPLSAPVTIPAGKHRVEIDYAALSLTAPERVKVKYRLSGIDKDWVDPGQRRQAFYTNLAPGNYGFRIIAANNDGVWNTVGSELRFYKQPTLFQTKSFWAFCLLLAGATAWMLYQRRLQQIAERVQTRLEGRLAERERIARELHDTLLQGFQGLVLKFGTVANSVASGTTARRRLDQALDQADQVLFEGRERVRDLRATYSSGDLAESIRTFTARLASDDGPEITVTVEGVPRRLDPAFQDEAFMISAEALSNAVRHARARHIQAKLLFHPSRFRLSIGDDGVGMAPEFVTQGCEGHFGLVGMRERAKAVAMTFDVLSPPTGGVEIVLTAPARSAYARAPGLQELVFFAKGRLGLSSLRRTAQ